MNVYALIILAALLLDYALGLVADVLNLKALRRDPPDELRDVYDHEAYARSQRYTRAKTRLGLVHSTVALAALLVFWLAGGFNRLDLWLRGFELGTVARGVAFIVVLGLLKGFLDLPFRLYSTFVVEERFGFNRTTAKTFVLDLAKGLGLGLALGAPLVAAVLWFFQQAGDRAWLYCWMLTTAFTLGLVFVFPVWILPLFHRLRPLEPGDLRTALAEYARSVGFALGDVSVIDGSRRSTHANAFFTGFGRSKRIALYDTLVERHSVPELVAVLAHEAGHAKRGHVYQGLAMSIAHNGLLFYLLSLFLERRGLHEAFLMEHVSIYAGLVFFGLLYAPIEILLALGMNLLLRRNELEADRFAAETSDPRAMVSALQKLAAENLVNLTPHPFHVFVNDSHPPVLERIRALRAFEPETPG